MAYKLVLHYELQFDVDSAVLWYESQQRGLGEVFLDDWEATLGYVSSHPFSHSKKIKSIRTALLKNFPFFIAYEIIENIIYIYSLTSSKQSSKSINSIINNRK